MLLGPLGHKVQQVLLAHKGRQGQQVMKVLPEQLVLLVRKVRQGQREQRVLQALKGLLGLKVQQDQPGLLTSAPSTLTI